MSICNHCGRNDQEPLAPCPFCAIGEQADPEGDEIARLRRELTTAITTEREACALVALSDIDQKRWDNAAAEMAARRIAAAIRARGGA